MDLGMVLEWVLKAIFLVLFLTIGFAYLTWFERRSLARFQVRIGPNRVGWQGLLQPIADAVKLIFKEELTPTSANKLIFLVAPLLTVLPALIITAVIPWGETVTLFGRTIELGLAGDVSVGVLYIIAVTSLSVYGITLAGWASNNKYALLGGLRSTAQMISYELALGLAIIGPVMVAGSLQITAIVNGQQPIWYIFLQPLAFAIYFTASIAEINRSPFDMPEAEQELTAGYHTEYSGMKFAVFFMAEYIKMICIAMIGTSLFLGGYHLPYIATPGLWGPLVFFAKVIIWLFVLVWIRATLPRIRYDRLMALGWKVLFPLAVFNVLITSVVLVLLEGS
jgi:NADH-quinone oxidoreductase subunit H